MPQDPKKAAVVADYFERAAWTAGQQFVAVLITTATTARAAQAVDLPWKIALGTALGAGLVSVLTTIGQRATPWKKLPFWPDLGVRLLKTFAASLLGTIGADVVNVLTFDWANALNVAAIATVAALGKGVLSRNELAGATQPNPSTLSAKTYELAYGPPS